MSPTYHSQFEEDRILAELFSSQSPGTCVEIGANDGQFGSTTLFFERAGWTVVLVEPNPALCEKLRRERSAAVFEYAASDRAGAATLHVAHGGFHADGVSMLGDAESAARRMKAFGFDSQAVEVRVRTLDSILVEAGVAAGFEFISIDVEGHELQVLRGFSLDRWRPRIVITEDNHQFTDRAVTKWMRKSGYVPFRRTGVNEWYAKEEDRELVSPENLSLYRNIRRQGLRRARLDRLKIALFERTRAIPLVHRIWRRLKP